MSKVIFANFDTFYSLYRAYRVIWIRGRFGGGKTLLAVAISAKLLADKYVDYVVSNVPVEFGVEAKKTEKMTDWAIVLDESWIYLNTRSSVYDYAAFVRKLNHYLLLPSVWPVHSRLQAFSVQRVFNAYVIGLPVWVYRYDVRMRVYNEHGYFALINPHALFGVYPTEYIPSDDGGVSELIDTFVGKKNGKRIKEEDEGSFELMEVIDEIDDSVSLVTESADMVTEAVKVLRKKKNG